MEVYGELVPHMSRIPGKNPGETLTTQPGLGFDPTTSLSLTFPWRVAAIRAPEEHPVARAISLIFEEIRSSWFRLECTALYAKKLSAISVSRSRRILQLL